MPQTVDEALDARYRSLYGVAAGYLPADRGAVDLFHDQLAADLRDRGTPAAPNPAVRALGHLLERDAIVRMDVSRMIEQALEIPGSPKTITNVYDLLNALDRIVTIAPVYAPKGSRNFFPMSALFTYMMFTPAGESVFRNAAFNEAIRRILKEWCAYLDSAASREVINTGANGWLSGPAREEYKLDDFQVDWSAPHGGFASYNDFFHREIKPAKRPIADPGDPRIVVSANDGTVSSIQRGVSLYNRFWIKAQPYSLADMLAGDEDVNRFVGGDVIQSFLSGANYHRWHAPVAGRITRAEVVDGLQFSEAESQGFDPDAGVLSAGYESAVNTRGLVYIETERVGTVVVMPIGITEISSITITVRPGQQVSKGEELGWFSYGGSTLCVVFQPARIERFTVAQPGPGGRPLGQPIDVNSRIAVATT
ncbi:MAG TPA: phophatidylserine decarboxylase associated domain-containing protein [Solirubrobacteraceae bacterium]|jgi:phosphatidylserine decarboxylase